MDHRRIDSADRDSVDKDFPHHTDSADKGYLHHRTDSVDMDSPRAGHWDYVDFGIGKPYLSSCLKGISINLTLEIVFFNYTKHKTATVDENSGHVLHTDFSKQLLQNDLII